MATTNLYRVSQGEIELVESAVAAIIPGTFDATNWGTDWMLFTAANPAEAMRISKRYDHALNSGAIRPPRYLKSLSRGWEQRLTDKSAI